MRDVDPEALLSRLGVKTTKLRGDELWGFCPDHQLFTGHEPSHDKWSMNTVNGKTKCLTEGRGSNIVRIVARLKGISPYEAVQWILDDAVGGFRSSLNRLSQAMNKFFPDDEISSFDSERFQKQINEADLEASSVSFLAECNIRPEIAQRFGCVEFPAGYYARRLIFPIRSLKEELVGFVATSVEKKEDWAKDRLVPDRDLGVLRKATEDDFKKVLYPKGFSVSSYLIGGHDADVSKGAFVNEGTRDMMKLRQEGFIGSVAVGGSSISESQIEQIASLGTKRIIVMMDGDPAGQRATQSIAEKCCVFFPEVYAVRLNKTQDPKKMMKGEFLHVLKNNLERVKMKRKFA